MRQKKNNIILVRHHVACPTLIPAQDDVNMNAAAMKTNIMITGRVHVSVRPQDQKVDVHISSHGMRQHAVVNVLLFKAVNHHNVLTITHVSADVRIIHMVHQNVQKLRHGVRNHASAVVQNHWVQRDVLVNRDGTDIHANVNVLVIHLLNALEIRNGIQLR